MTIMPNGNEKDNSIVKCCEAFIKRFGINRLLRKANAGKEKGFPASSVFAFLLGLVFSGKNLYTLLTESKEKVAFGKDTVYRFLGNAGINWNMFLFWLSCAVITDVDKLTSDERKTALVIDDTAYYRDRSKKVELLSRFYDHAEHRYYKGYELLTVGWTDGQTFLPVDFRLSVNSDPKKLLHDPPRKEDKRTLAARRRADARKSKPELVLDMLRNILGTCAQAKYVLFDSWFSSPSAILSIRDLGYHVVARLKNNVNLKYIFNEEELSLSQIFSKNKKRRGRSRYLLSVNISVTHKDFENAIPAMIVYVRDRNDRKKWIAIISTDTSLSEDEIIALYGKRWDIEPFHKVIKSLLRLGKEFQLRSFDASTAHTAIVMTRYLLLSLENRENKDLCSVNEGFRYLCDELEDISFSFAFELIMRSLSASCSDFLRLSSDQLSAFVDHFIASLPAFIKQKLPFSSCES